ncbi:MAG: F0F1 ATP synthase subunit delta, partial [Pseudomonadota bacterium]
MSDATPSAPSSLTSSAAGRYATALFDLAKEGGMLETIEADLDQMAAALGDSKDLSHLIASPVHSRAEQGRAMAAIADAMGLSGLTKNVIGLMAEKRRLFALPKLIEIYRALMAQHRGEVTAEVTAAKALTKGQTDALSAKLAASVGRDVKLNVTVDASIIGGLIV